MSLGKASLGCDTGHELLLFVVCHVIVSSKMFLTFSD